MSSNSLPEARPPGRGLVAPTQSAQLYLASLLNQAGIPVAKLVEARLTPEQAKHVIEVATANEKGNGGVRIPAGLLEWAMAQEEARQDAYECAARDEAQDTVSNFQNDPLGRWNARMTGSGMGGRQTLLHRLISQQPLR